MGTFKDIVMEKKPDRKQEGGRVRLRNFAGNPTWGYFRIHL